MSSQHDHVENEAAPARAYGGMTSEERRQMRRERLVEAGLEVFGRRGLPQTTMRDICTHARLSDRYFYESFMSVQDVFEAVYVHLRTQLLARLREAMAQTVQMKGAARALDKPVSVAEAGLRAFFQFVQDDPRRARIMLIDVLGLRYSHLGGTQNGDGVFQVAPYVSMFGDFFRALYPHADELDIDVDMVHKTLIGMTVQSAAVWADRGFDKSIDDILRHNLFAWEGLDLWMQRMMAERHKQQSAAALKVVATKRGAVKAKTNAA